MAVSGLDETEQRHVKISLWNGRRQQDVADAAGLSIHMIGSIMAGKAYARIPWPDGSTGRMSDERRREISRMNHARIGEKNRHYRQAKAMEPYDRMTQQKNLDRRRAIRHLEQNGEMDPSEERINWMLSELREADRLSDERVARIQEEEHRARMQKAAEEQAAYEQEMSKLPPEVETDDDRDNRLCRDLWEIGTLKLRTEVADKIRRSKLVWLMEMNNDQPGVFMQLKAYLERSNETVTGSGDTAKDQSGPGHADK